MRISDGEFQTVRCQEKSSVGGGGGEDGNVTINPRRDCAARVTVLGLSFCLSVCLLPRFLPLRATRRPISDTYGFRATLALFLK